LPRFQPELQATTGIEGERVNLFARRAGTATTAADGAAAFTPAPAAITTYRTSFPGSDTHGTASSPQVTITVRPTVTARLQASTVTTSQSVTVTCSVVPNHHRQRVYLHRLANGSWKGLATATPAAPLREPSPRDRGSFIYRVVKRARADHTSATSSTLTVAVR
jgi:hypothetical protein